MKTSTKIFALSALTLAVLVGCGKKDKPETDIAKPEVTERPVMVCDDAATKNQVINQVKALLLEQANKTVEGDALAQALKARLSQLDIDLQNIHFENGECTAQLHIVLSEKDVAAANRAFADAYTPSLEEKAMEAKVSLMGGHRLVGNFSFMSEDGAVIIDKRNPVFGLTMEVLGESVRSTSRQTRANAQRETSQIGAPNPDIIPAPTVTVRPVELPQMPPEAAAILRPEDMPSGTPSGQAGSGSQAGSASQERPAPEQPTPNRSEPAESHRPVQDDSVEITVVEGNDTY